MMSTLICRGNRHSFNAFNANNDAYTYTSPLQDSILKHFIEFKQKLKLNVGEQYSLKFSLPLVQAQAQPEPASSPANFSSMTKAPGLPSYYQHQGIL